MGVVKEPMQKSASAPEPPTDKPVELTPAEKKALLPEKYRHTNWRIEMMSVPRRIRPKYVGPDPHACVKTGVRPSALTAVVTERVDHMSRNSIRSLSIVKKSYTKMLGPKFVKSMDTKIDQSWNSLYNYYKKALRDKKKTKGKKGKAPAKGKGKEKTKGAKGTEKSGAKGTEKPKKPKSIANMTPEEKDKEFIEWAKTAAIPKKPRKPPPLKRGKIADLVKMGPRIVIIAKPKRVYIRPSQDSMNPEKLMKVKASALKYVASYRVCEIAQPAAFRMIKEEPMIPGAVQPGALKAVISPRMAEMAVPKARAAAKEADFNENAFTISPGALKYVATPRVLELAKPTER